jgi:hypothetical protein
MHLQLSEQSRLYYGGGKHAEFVDDVMMLVHEKYGSEAPPSEWIIKDMVRVLETNVDFWKRWNHVDHLCATHADLKNLCFTLKTQVSARHLQHQGGGGEGGGGKGRGSG